MKPTLNDQFFSRQHRELMATIAVREQSARFFQRQRVETMARVAAAAQPNGWRRAGLASAAALLIAVLGLGLPHAPRHRIAQASWVLDLPIESQVQTIADPLEAFDPWDGGVLEDDVDQEPWLNPLVMELP
jgi:hypothetical protein